MNDETVHRSAFVVSVPRPAFLLPPASSASTLSAMAHIRSFSAIHYNKTRFPDFYPYMQTYDHAGRTVHRRGFFALVRLSPFGEGHVVPHEKTYKGAIEDRFA